MTLDPTDSMNPCTSLYELGHIASAHDTPMAHAMLHAIAVAKWVSFYGWME